MDSEKCYLNWKDFQRNRASSFQEMREFQEFADVTLVCEDNQRLEAHKVILSSASNFFRSVLTGNKHSHPLIYMRRVKKIYLEPMLDFMYYGKTEINQEDVEEFLLLAEELEIKELTSNLDVTKNGKHKLDIKKAQTIKDIKVELCTTTSLVQEPKEEIITSSNYEQQYVLEGPVLFQDENTELDGIITSMLERVHGIWKCSKCDKTHKQKYQARRHVETHIEGIAHPCNFCGKKFRYLNCLL